MELWSLEICDERKNKKKLNWWLCSRDYVVISGIKSPFLSAWTDLNTTLQIIFIQIIYKRYNQFLTCQTQLLIKKIIDVMTGNNRKSDLEWTLECGSVN